VLNGHTDYTRFIILGRSRTGSNHLRGLLNSHSQVVVFGELFSNYDSMDWAYPGYQQSDRMMELAQSDPVRFLETEVFAPFPAETAAVGFKLFYYHARAHGWDRLWTHLQEDRTLRVLHIKRVNILRTHLSREKAQASGVWVQPAAAGQTNQTRVDTWGAGRRPVHLDYQACLDDFVRTRAWEQEFDAFFADHPLLEIQYETLAADHEAEMRRVESFLGLKHEELRAETHQQSTKPLSASIANYAELKARFEGSPWQEFFSEMPPEGGAE
jgi:LPS sulfotransferase NodH